MVGAEALVRWQHPVRGMVPPASFIPIAEETGIVVQLDRWVLGQACRFAADDHRRGQNFRVSVNISPRPFTEDDFVQHVQQCLVDTGLAAAALTREVTEGVLVHDIDAVASGLKLEIVAEGVETAEQAAFILPRAPQALMQGYRFSRPTEAPQWSPEPSPQKSEGAPSASA